MTKSMISLSGGMDSATLLGTILRDQHKEVYAVAFVYPSKHNPYEVHAAETITNHYNVPLQIVNMIEAFRGFRSALLKTGGPIPQGHYEEESMRQTVVPMRNMIFLSIMAGLAQSLECDTVYMGVHAGDHYIYPDCRPSFIGLMNRAIMEASEGTLRLLAPFWNKTKADILSYAKEFDVPLHLTRTCYADQDLACGLCGSCQERLAAFAELDMTDPLPYNTRKILPKQGS